MNDDDTTTTSPDRQDMSLSRFRELVDAYGGDDDRWPESERQAAYALAARSPEAGAILESAARLDRILAGLSPPAPSAGLRKRLTDLGPRSRGRTARALWPGRGKQAGIPRRWRPLAVGGAAAAIIAAALWIAMEPIPGPEPAAPVPVVVAEEDTAETALLDGVAMVDMTAGRGFDSFSDADLGRDGLAGSGGAGFASSGGEMAGLALE